MYLIESLHIAVNEVRVGFSSGISSRSAPNQPHYSYSTHGSAGHAIHPTANAAGAPQSATENGRDKRAA